MKPRIAVIVIATLLAFVSVSSVPARSGQDTTVPQAGAPPQRLISLIPAVTEMLIAIGVGDRLVGVSSFDRLPDSYASVPRVGGLLDPDVERVLSLRPDLVLYYGTQDELKVQLTRAKVPSFGYEHGGLADIPATIRALATRVGRQPEGEKVAGGIERRIAEVRRKVAPFPRPLTLLVFGREARVLKSIDASGGYGFLHDILDAAGGRNVFADLPKQMIRATTEVILSRRPEVILELRARDHMTPADLDAERQSWNPLASVPAVRANRVYVLGGMAYLQPGPGVGDTIETLARVLHPEAFK